ncbi:MAG TPA: hypothetical protein PLY90_04210 [Candidatus Hydrogenedentes bacterium]|jgi:hypothetical protein|nr:MAG: hypothetical protein BWY07_02105 [Candidatus Hydrogenedentes bacterium ADurb.Bin170]HNZ49140.1 hypothetical protein [Candidatus Hydrogenedentota bacterium]HOD96177.1 hypothetical protein [Candidatus Hydrogenedentota bacterium]HOR51824.1 hypothetical protein [Candidatus Hydrogenedentota bacterium]HPK25752.1 hypothetical protein [Candidatus Hydrogenedentota bacterium]
MIKKVLFLQMVCIVITLAAGCQSTKIPKDALLLKEESMQLRQAQTRSFDTVEEKVLLAAAAGVLQDLGFTLDESEMDLGVLVGSKDRDAREFGQAVGSFMVAAIFGVKTSVDKDQKIRASLVTSLLDGERTKLRVTFQRVVWNNEGKISRTEAIEDIAIYQEFFEKLSKSVFLEAHEI